MLDGLYRWKDGKATSYQKRSHAGMVGDEIESLFEDENGRIWVSAYGGLVAFADGKFNPVPSVPAGATFAIARDEHGGLWLSVWPDSGADGLMHLLDGKVTANLDAVELGSVSSYFHRSDDIWIDATQIIPVGYSDAVAAQYLFQQGTFMQELRLRSADPNASLAWDIGAFYSTMNLRQTQNLAGALSQFSLPGSSLTETARSQQTRLAGFGEVSVRLAKGLARG